MTHSQCIKPWRFITLHDAWWNTGLSISKAALSVLTRKLAVELLNTGILVNSVDPGWVAKYMGGHGGRPVHEGAKGIVWAVTSSDDDPSREIFCDGKAVPW